MTPIGIKLSLSGQKEVSDGLKQVGNDVNNLGNAGGKLGSLGQGMEKAALSAGQLKMATQQLPMQFQDIVVSLQAGQQPLTVLLQQGSQLAGSFGGAGAAAKAMLGYIVGLVNPVTVLAGSVAALGVAYYQGSKEQDAWIRGIVTTGNASGVTVGQLRDYARAIDGIVGTQRDAAMGLNDFVQAGVRGGEELRRYTEAALLWERATGQAVNTTAKQFADLQKAPLQSVLKLNEGTNFLTVSVYEQIQALEEQGNKTEAARVAMDALEGSMRERAQQIEESLGYIEKGWKWVTEAADEAWDAMLGVGRKKTNRDLLRETQAELDVRLSRSDVLGNDEHLERGNAKLRARIAHLQDLVAQEDLNAASQAESARLMRARESFDSKYSKALEGEVALQQKLAVARKEAEAAGKSEADIKKVLAYVTEEHNKSLNKGGSSAKTAQTGYQNLLSTINQKIVAMQTEAKTGEKLTETEKLRARYQEELNTKGRQYTAQHRERIEAGLALLEQQEKQKIAAQELVKANEEDARTLERLTQQRERSAEALEQSVKAAREEEQAAALAAASNITHAEAVAQLAQARAEDAYMQAVANGEAPKTLEFLEREMQARRQLTQLMGQRVVREANKKAADDAAKAWDKVIDGVGDGFYTAIVSDGASALQALQRVAEGTILRPMVQYGANNIAGAIGLSSEGSASSLSTAASMVKNGHSIYGALTGSLTYGLGSAAASIGAAIGSTAATSFGAGMAASGFTASAFSTGASMVGAGATSTGLGMMAGAALPWVAGGLAIASLLGGMDFGSRGANHVGGAYSSEGLNDKEIMASLGFGLSSNKAQDITKRSNPELDKSVAGLASGLLGAYNQLASVLGGNKAQINAAFAINPKYDDEKSYGYFQLRDEIGNLLVDYDNRKLSKDHDKAWEQYANDMANAFVGQLRESDITGWADDILTALGDEVSVEGFAAAAQQIAVVDAAFKGWAQTLTGFDGLSADLQTTLVRVSGGFDALSGNLSTWYAGYYSEQERYENSLKQMRDVLAGLDLSIDPAMGDRANEEYRRVAEDALKAGNAELYAQMISLGGLFAQLADRAEQASQRIASSLAQSVSGAWANLGTAAGWAASYLGDGSGLQAQMGVVQASYAGATTVQGREAALEQIIALEQALWELEDRNRQAAAQAAQRQAEALQSQLASVNSLIAAAQNLGKYAEGLFTGADSGLGDQERLGILAAQYSTQLSLAKAGDTDAMSSLQGTTSAYLQLAQQLSGSQSEYSVLSGRIAAELAATAVVSEASAKTQADTLQAQISAAQAAAQYASQQFEVSAATKELIAKQLADSAKQFDSEMSLLQQQVQAGMNTNYLLEGMPVELTGVLNTTLVPVIGRISDAAMAAASMSAASAEAARQAAAAAAAAAASAAAAALANARKGIDGSHYSGLSYVPFDGYRAELHKGERVLTAAENRMFSMPAIQVQSQNSSKELEKKVERLEAQMARMADATERLLDITDRVTADGNANATEIMNVRELAKAIAEEMA